MTDEHRPGRNLPTIVTLVVVVALVALLALAGRSVWHYFRHPPELRALVVGWGAWSPVGIVVLQTLQIVVAPLPGNVVSFVCGYALGFWPAILWVMLGVMVGATVDFLLGRLLGRRLLTYLLPPERLTRFDSLVLRRGTFYIFLLLFIPNPVGDVVYYLAGLTALPLPVFLGLVLLARLPSNVIECALGSSAVRFGVQEWAVLGGVAVALTVLYFVNQRHVERLIERWVAAARRRTMGDGQ